MPVPQIFTTPYGAARILTLEEVASGEWAARSAPGLRRQIMLAQTLEGGFEHHWLLLEDREGRARALQSFFVVDQDLVMASGRALRAAAAAARRIFPRCLSMRMLMVGSPTGIGRIEALDPADEAWTAAALHAVLGQVARALKASLMLLKDFAPADRERLTDFSSNGYSRIASMPMTRLALDFTNFEEHAQRLGKATRKSLRRKFRASAEAGALDLEVVADASAVVDEIFPLYLQVHARSPLRFERLTPEYLRRVGREAPEETRFFLWRRAGRIVAFSLCRLEGDVIYDEYLGLDYAVALDLHLYFVTLRDVLDWSVARGLREYRSTPLNYDPKLRLKFALAPLDLYAAPTSPWMNPLFRRILPLIQPVRSDPHIRHFENAHEL